ncbi:MULTISPECIES: hypothetical protein [Pontibacillus]|uniref:Uncharacterized protein n=1 Tax=Pontibacillus chungwhensis TaxID=265426 RepID=A0ABY8UWI6_9BACI|nr:MULTISPECIES: hypothetical protein [Pontibacillus]MCD5325722.1 hypothetical protein [Pontibacillus sp. HN14]WIF98040.1 hypothetical protein QNI29_20315 [Pontibacillus chungwhensis]
MAFLSPNFFIRSIRIGTVESASCVNFGNNAPNGFESTKKHNQGFGSIHGDGNDVKGIRSLLNDSSFMDLLSQSKDHEIPQWLQTAIEQKIAQEGVEE